MFGALSPTARRIRQLQAHLQHENPTLLDAVKSFRRLDRIAYRLGILSKEDSFATRVPWWPLISVLGTFSSGKSTFINSYLGQKVQITGNQAVDDKFTVICFGNDETGRALPGLALDSDPRFPFYQISRDLEEVASGEGRRVDAYLQLKTCRSEALRGKILIDSPGFDADAQRNSTLRLTDYIIDLSDLVLVFFDARHPEPGAMKDTLEHLVGKTINRSDSNKFLYILNQIDNAAREDNPEEVFASWQRALAHEGLTAGRFYSIFDRKAAIPIEDEHLRRRFEHKRAVDYAAIAGRLQQVEEERAYRIIAVLDQTAASMEDTVVPALRAAKLKWKRRVLWFDAVVFGLIGLGLLSFSVHAGYWQGLRFAPGWLEPLLNDRLLAGLALGGAAAIAIYLHFALRKIAAQTVAAGLRRDPALNDVREWVLRAFGKNVRWWRPFMATEPAGWGRWTRRQLVRIRNDANRYVQSLNNRFADPSGTSVPRDPARGVVPGAAERAMAAGGRGYGSADTDALSPQVPSPPADYPLRAPRGDRQAAAQSRTPAAAVPFGVNE